MTLFKEIRYVYYHQSGYEIYSFYKKSVYYANSNSSNFFISRDPGYFEAIDKIGQHFFGLPEPQRPRGMFSGLMDSFFSAMNESEDEDGGGSNPALATTNNNTNAPSISMDSQDLD